MKSRKGVTSFMFGVIIAAILAGFLIWPLASMATETIGGSKKLIESSIYRFDHNEDNDAKNDFEDASPCVSGELIITIKEDKHDYAYYSEPVEKEGAFTCELAEWDKEKGYELKLATQLGTEDKVCVLLDDSCARALKKSYDALKEEEQ